MKKNILLILSIFAMFSAANAATEFFVSPNGDDLKGDGTSKKPFASFAKAANAVMEGKDTDYKIIVSAGNYEMPKTVLFGKNKMKGKKLAIIGVSEGEKRARLLGARSISGDKLTKVTNPEILAKVAPDAEGTLYSLDLKKFGMNDYGKLGRRGWGYGNPAFEMTAYKNYNALTTARYPNTIKPMPIGKVLDNGTITHDIGGLRKMPKDDNVRGGTFICDDSRVKRWGTAPDAWIAGNMSAGWAYEHTPIKSLDTASGKITLAAPSVYGVWSNTVDPASKGYPARADLSVRGFHIFNLLEEADEDGEYYIDRKNGIFYVMLKNAPTKNDVFSFSLSSSPILHFDKVNDVELTNLDISMSRDIAIMIAEGHNFKITKCILSGCKAAANVYGYNIKFDRCVVCNNMAGGIIFRGGNAKTLKRANSEITNTEFYENATRRERGSHALTINGVGLRIANCHFHDHPDHTVVYIGSYITIERNIFERCCRNASDMGVIYGGGISGAHERVVRNNFFTENIVDEKGNNSMICGVYLDEGGFDLKIYNNIFCRTGSQGRSTAFGAIYIHGGAEAKASNNVFINCDSAFGCQPWTNEKFRAKLEHRRNNKSLWEELNSDIYKKAYPDIAKILNPEIPRINYAERNKLFCTSMAMNGDLRLRENRWMTPVEGVSKGMLFEKKNWTLADVEKYFGEEALVKNILKVPMGILK